MFLFIFGKRIYKFGFIVRILMVALKWIWTFLVTNSFNFLCISWVFSPAFSFSRFYWKFKIISIRNYNQQFTLKKASKEFCRNLISYIRKAFKLVAIACNVVIKSVTVAPRSGFPIKYGSEYLLVSISFSRLLIAVHLTAAFGLSISKEITKSSQDKSIHTSALLTDSNGANRFTLDLKITVSLSFLQRIDESPLGNVFRFNFQKQSPGSVLQKRCS